MLKKAPDELHDIERHGPPSLAVRLSVPEIHPAVFDLDDAPVGDGHFKDVRGQIAEAVMAVGQGLAVDVEVFLPDAGIDVGGGMGTSMQKCVSFAFEVQYRESMRKVTGCDSGLCLTHLLKWTWYGHSRTTKHSVCGCPVPHNEPWHLLNSGLPLAVLTYPETGPCMPDLFPGSGPEAWLIALHSASLSEADRSAGGG